MKKLSDLLLGTHLMQTAGPMDMPVQGLTQDSRQVKPTFAFVAVKGTQTDGHTYIDKALGLGASVIICEVWPEELQKNVTYLQVDDAATALGQMASHFYGNPSKKMKVVAITGTNGKTTVATLLFQLFSGLGYKCGLLSTVRNLIG